ncbi:MAG: PAS domain S-box protein [Verrucomicrobiota bacterium]
MQHRNLNNRLLQDAKVQAEVIAYSTKYVAEISGFSPKLNRAVMAFGIEQDISSVVVILEKNLQVMSSSRIAWKGKNIMNVAGANIHKEAVQKLGNAKLMEHLWLHYRDEHRLFFLTPFFVDSPDAPGKLDKAWVIVEKNTHRLEKDIENQLKQTAFLFISIILLLSGFIYLLLEKRLFQPLSAIAESIRTHSAGESHSLSALRQDEIGDLAKTLSNAWNKQKKSEKELNIILNSVPALIFYKDAENNIIRLNMPAAEAMGLTVEEVEGKNAREFFPTVAEDYHKDDLEVIESGEPKLGIIECFEPKSGGRRWIETDKVPYYNDQGDIVGVIALVKDITEQHMATTALSDREKKLKNILENMIDGLAVVDQNGNVQSFNPACERIFGYQSEHMIGVNISRLIPESHRLKYKKYLSENQKSGIADIIGVGRTLEAQRKNGEIFPLELSVSELPVDGEVLYCGFLRDITDRKKAEDDIRTKNKDLEMMLHVVSHDLREPLRTIANFSDLLKEEYYEAFDDEAADYIKRISRGVDRMRLLLDAIMDLSRAKNKSFTLEPMDIRECIESSLESLDASIHGAKAQIDISNGFHPFKGDKTWMKQVFNNLIHNAIKFSGDSPPRIQIMPYEEKIDHVTVRGVQVLDRGIGVPEIARAKIFTLFQRAVGRNVEGTGAGLAIVSQIIQRHGGKIWIEPREGGGSKFIFTLS